MDGEIAAALVDAAPVGLLIVDEIGTIKYASPSTETLTGYGYGDVVGTNIIEYLHEEAITGLLESVSYVQEYTEAIMGPVSLGFLHADGERRVLEAYGANRYSDPVLEGLIVVVRDVTLQYEVNAALTKYTQGDSRADVLKQFCHAVLGLPIRGRAAIVDSIAGVPMASVRLPDDIFGPAPAGEPPRPWELAVETGEGMFPPDPSGFDASLRAILEREGLATMWAYPIAGPVPDERSPTLPTACLVIGRVEGGDASLNERMTVEMVARSAALVTERDYLISELSKSARTDALTGLGNRAHLFRSRTPDEITVTLHAASTAALYIDLDGFKPVNDTYGHAAGDAVLIEVARRLKVVCRRDDELGRIGGDEFVMICWSVDASDEAISIADRIVQSLAEPIVVADGNGQTAEVTIGASIGIALRPTSVGNGAPPEPLDELLRRADEALYEAKREGKGQWRMAVDR